MKASDDRAFELGQSAEDLEHQLTGTPLSIRSSSSALRSITKSTNTREKQW